MTTLRKSILLCEGKDDLWFLNYYLRKASGWEPDTEPQDGWTNYQVLPQNEHQEVEYMIREPESENPDRLALWSVGGKDAFREPIQIILTKYVRDYPDDAVRSIVVFRDRDEDREDAALSTIRKWTAALPLKDGTLELSQTLENGKAHVCTIRCNGITADTTIVPVIIPFNEEGAVETLLIRSIRDRGTDEEAMVQAAVEFVDSMAKRPAHDSEKSLREKYMEKRRKVLKARFSAVSAIVNPAFSTDKFREIVMDCDWETTPYIREHFSPILRAVQSG